MSQPIMVSTRKGLFTVAKNGSGAYAIRETAFLGDNVSLSLVDARSGHTYAALDHGHFGAKLHRRERDGAWHEISTPVYPEKPEGYEEFDMWGRPLPWSTVRIWALEAGGADEPGVIWCGTIPGGLFRSNDHGESWEIITSLWHHPKRKQWMGGGADLPGLHTILIDPRNPKHLWIAVSTGGIWHTADAGETWTQRGEGMRADHVPPEMTHDPLAQDVHCLALCPADPSRMWVQHHNGIFVSNDEGRTFTEISERAPSAFGFPVVTHPADPAKAWFVPGIKDEKRIPVDGRLSVTRTRDGGATFETLSTGLPQEHAYDVVFRHALAIDATGSRLAFGSTTGGLWASDDEGESWTMVSHTLPPIYAVRFG